jgi:hypothetical protein
MGRSIEIFLKIYHKFPEETGEKMKELSHKSQLQDLAQGLPQYIGNIMLHSYQRMFVIQVS